MLCHKAAIMSWISSNQYSPTPASSRSSSAGRPPSRTHIGSCAGIITAESPSAGSTNCAPCSACSAASMLSWLSVVRDVPMLRLVAGAGAAHFGFSSDTVNVIARKAEAWWPSKPAAAPGAGGPARPPPDAVESFGFVFNSSSQPNPPPRLRFRFSFETSLRDVTKSLRSATHVTCAKLRKVQTGAFPFR